MKPLIRKILLVIGFIIAFVLAFYLWYALGLFVFIGSILIIIACLLRAIGKTPSLIGKGSKGRLLVFLGILFLFIGFVASALNLQSWILSIRDMNWYRELHFFIMRH